MPTDYDLAVRVLKTRLDGLKWYRRQLADEMRDIRNDPEMGKGCHEYDDARKERHDVCVQIDLLERIINDLDDDVRDLAQSIAMGYER